MQTKIFIAEDDPALLPMVVYNLQKEGFLVREATDGEGARTMLHEERPDLAIIDWMMPHLSGLQLCKHIRRSPGFAGLAGDYADSARRARRPGAGIGCRG